MSSLFFFFNDTATTEIYTLSLHDALPISMIAPLVCGWLGQRINWHVGFARSEEHTSELQSQSNLVCRLLLEKKIEFSPVFWFSSCCSSARRFVWGFSALCMRLRILCEPRL